MLLLSTLLDRLEQIDALQAVGPTNLAAEQARFLEAAKSGHFISPQFCYGKLSEEEIRSKMQTNQLLRDEILRAQKVADPKSDFIIYLALHAIDRQQLVGEFALSALKGDEVTTNELLRQFYGVASPELIATAMSIADGNPISNPYLDDTKQICNAKTIEKYDKKDYMPHDMKRTFDAILEDYNLQKDWSVIIDDTYASITVTANGPKTGKHEIHIPTTRPAENVFTVLKLAGHEIENHVRHNTNTIRLFMKEFGLDEATATRLELTALNSIYVEGLAKVSDALIEKKCLGTTGGAPHPWYVIAADRAARGESFGQIAEYICSKGETAAFAFKIVSRVFRGCTDTANRHNYSRQHDRDYLEGYIEAIKTYDNPAIFNFGKFNFETMAMLEKAIGRPLADVSPSIRFLDVTDGLIRLL